MTKAKVRNAAEDIEKATMRCITWRLLPYLMLSYFIAYVDRVNVGFAALTMKDIGLSESVFGFGASMFFIAYVLFEIPSNLALQKVGARLWVARIMISWGIVGMATSLVVGPYSFYLARFLLGAAEAGFFPGVILYLTYWFPRAYRARIIATFMVAIPVSNFLGSPLSALLLEMDGVAGLSGWQWLFLVESVPAVILGLLALRILTKSPAEADWLAPEQRAWLQHRLATEASAETLTKPSLWTLARNGQVWLFAVIYCGSSATSNALSLWQPQILKSFNLTTLQTGLLNMIPFGLASLFMILWGIRADQKAERMWATALPLALTSLSLFLTLATDSLSLTLVLLSLVLIGNYAVKGPFWALVTERLPASIVAASVAAINTFAHLGTGGASALLGIIRERTGSFALALTPLAVLTAAGALTVLYIGRRRQSELSQSMQST